MAALERYSTDRHTGSRELYTTKQPDIITTLTENYTKIIHNRNECTNTILVDTATTKRRKEVFMDLCEFQ